MQNTKREIAASVVRKPWLQDEDEETSNNDLTSPTVVIEPYKKRPLDDTRNQEWLPPRERWWGECEMFRCTASSNGAYGCPDGIERELCEWHATYEV